MKGINMGSKTTYYCDKCSKETSKLRELKISASDWSIVFDLCNECFEPFNEVKKSVVG